MSAFALIEAAAVVAGSYADGTLIGWTAGKSPASHYGVIAVLVTNPLLIISVIFIYSRFRRTLATLPLPANSVARLRQFLARRTCWFLLNPLSVMIYAALVVMGILSFVVNIVEARNPLPYYGNLVFDSADHKWGFLTTKSLFLVTWVGLYPLVGVAVLTLSIAARSITDFLRGENVRLFDVTHPDRSYGLRNLASVHVSMVLPYLLFFLVFFGVISTHAKIYASKSTPILIALMLCIFGTAVFVKFVVWPLVRLAQKVHKAAFNELSSNFSERMPPSVPAYLEYSLKRICYNNVDRYFYSQGARVALSLLTPIIGLYLKFKGV